MVYLTRSFAERSKRRTEALMAEPVYATPAVCSTKCLLSIVS